MSKHSTFLFLGFFSFTADDNTRGTFMILASAKDPKDALKAFDNELNRQYDTPGGVLHQFKNIAAYCNTVTLLGEVAYPDSIMINFLAHQLKEDQILDAAFIPQMGTFPLPISMPMADSPDGGKTNLFWVSNPENKPAVAQVEQVTNETLNLPQESKG